MENTELLGYFRMVIMMLFIVFGFISVTKGIRFLVSTFALILTFFTLGTAYFQGIESASLIIVAVIAILFLLWAITNLIMYLAWNNTKRKYPNASPPKGVLKTFPQFLKSFRG